MLDELVRLILIIDIIVLVTLPVYTYRLSKLVSRKINLFLTIANLLMIALAIFITGLIFKYTP